MGGDNGPSARPTYPPPAPPRPPAVQDISPPKAATLLERTKRQAQLVTGKVLSITHKKDPDAPSDW